MARRGRVEESPGSMEFPEPRVVPISLRDSCSRGEPYRLELEDDMKDFIFKVWREWRSVEDADLQPVIIQVDAAGVDFDRRVAGDALIAVLSMLLGSVRNFYIRFINLDDNPPRSWLTEALNTAHLVAVFRDTRGAPSLRGYQPVIDGFQRTWDALARAPERQWVRRSFALTIGQKESRLQRMYALGVVMRRNFAGDPYFRRLD